MRESDRELWETFGEAVSGKNALHQLISLLLSDSRPTSQRRKPQHLLATDHLLCKAAGQSFAASFQLRDWKFSAVMQKSSCRVNDQSLNFAPAFKKSLKTFSFFVF